MRSIKISNPVKAFFSRVVKPVSPVRWAEITRGMSMNLRLCFALLISMSVISCSKDDHPPEIPTGSFVKSMLFKESEEPYMRISFTYDSENRLIRQVFDKHTLFYEYNQRGELISYRKDKEEYYSFKYTNGILTAISKHDPDTREVWTELPVTFSEGIYAVDGKPVCRVDDKNQLLALPQQDAVFSYGEASGPHRNLLRSPARYMFPGGELSLYDLSLSGQELLGWAGEDYRVIVENKRNAEGQITQVLAHTSWGEEFEWTIEYEKRRLIP